MEISDENDFKLQFPLISQQNSGLLCKNHIYANEESYINSVESYKLVFLKRILY